MLCNNILASNCFTKLSLLVFVQLLIDTFLTIVIWFNCSVVDWHFLHLMAGIQLIVRPEHEILAIDLVLNRAKCIQARYLFDVVDHPPHH